MTQRKRLPSVGIIAGVAWLFCLPRGGAGEARFDVSFPTDRVAAVRGFLQSHCLKCHSEQTENGVRLDDIPVRFAAVEDVERWQKVLGVLNAGEMPPVEEPVPPAAAKTEFLALLSETLVSARAAIADQGRIAALRRLNRREYAVTLRVLTGLAVDVASLPDDAGGGGFDTTGASLFMSSDQFEQYLAVGRKAAAAAIDLWKRSAEPMPSPTTVRTEVEIQARRQMGGLLNGYFLGGYRQAKAWEAAGADPAKTKDFGFPDEHEAKFRIHAYQEHGPYLGQYLALPKADEGAWLTYYSGDFHHTETITIPADAPPGKYLLRLNVGGNEATPVCRRFLEMGIVAGDDFRRLDVFQVTTPLAAPQVIEVPVTITSDGPRAFSFREKRHADTDGPWFQSSLAKAVNGVGLDCALWVDWVEWKGPLPDPTAADACLAFFGSAFPANPDATTTRAILERVATRAFRGVLPDAGYLDRLLAVYEGQRAAGKSFGDAIVEPVAVILASPAFLYLNEPIAPSEAGAGNESPDEIDRQLPDLELASRLSYFLWAAPPDDDLLAAAVSGSLRSTEGLESQTCRMIADARSFEMAKGFAHQWLDIDLPP